VRHKGKLIKWNAEKAFGFIQPNRGGVHVFIHKTALSNRHRTPQINDIITFSITKDKEARFCASDARFLGEKFDKKTHEKSNQFSTYLPFLFLAMITAAYFFGLFPQKLLFCYFCFSGITFLAYAFDKSKAQRGAWRIKESTLHFFSVIGGWPGAAIAQQLLRHKSQKRRFRIVFGFTVIVNIGGLIYLFSASGIEYLKILY
jgi:uncharacterized membrane protein YsdA (DUF1294 family)/cold shock CspA family protein